MPKLNTFLNPVYLQKTKVINELSQELFSLLPSVFITHCHIANIDLEHGRLLIACESSVWANKLRYYHPDITKHFLTKHKTKVWQIKTCVMPFPLKINLEKASRSQLPSSAAQNLRSLAENISHPQLQAALIRLSRHH